jgi:hypothetical protein
MSNLIDSKVNRKLTSSAVQVSNTEDVDGTALGVGVKVSRAGNIGGTTTATGTTGQSKSNCYAGED